MRITDLLKPEAVKLGAKAKDKADAINQLVTLMEKEGNITDAAVYKKDVLAREEQFSTGMDGGIAIPHGKSKGVSKAGLAAMTVPSGVDYKSSDGKPTKLMFLIAAPDTAANEHLEVLSKLSTLLMDSKFVADLEAAKSVEEFRAVVDKAEKAKDVKETKAKKEASAGSTDYRILAITACPTGIAHTYMAAEGIQKKGEELGIPIKVETQGSVGAKNVLTAAEIAKADGIIIAADKNVDLSRFEGKRVYVTNVTKGINAPEELINKITSGEAAIYHSGKKAAASASSDEKDSAGHTIYKHLMSGVSHMLPFVVGGGILIAIAFLLDGAAAGTSSFGSSTVVPAFFKGVGGVAFGFMLPILAGYIAYSIADRPGLAVGFVGGSLAASGTTFATLMDKDLTAIPSGFLGALIAGFLGGYLVLGLGKIFDKLPDSLEGIKPVLLYPLFGILIIGLVMFIINPFVGAINTGITNWLNGLGDSNKILLGLVVGGMMSVDMGGPVNKAAYVFGTAQLATQTQVGQEIMAAVMVGGMVPPIVTALSTTFFKNRWTEDERKAGLVNYIMGASFISEGAIPFAAADPLRVLVSCIIGSGVAGSLSMAFGCASPAPHGGLWVAAVLTNWPMFIVALIAGSVVGALILSFWKKPLSPEESGLEK
ncbi:MAG: fructose-specific PTS transporter subunit EIIC [Atopobiaceae bacterium]|jgi:PTS system fructose-specific IIC component